MEFGDPHVYKFMGAVWTTLEDVMNLIMLPPYGETNAMGALSWRRMRRSYSFDLFHDII